MTMDSAGQPAVAKAEDGEVPTVWVDLSQETFQLTVCGACYALIALDYWPDHQRWHAKGVR